MTTNERRIYEKALETFGRDSQMHMCSEEMSELNKVLMKIFRNGFAEQCDNLIDELADVRITTEQIEYIFGISAKVEKRRQEKLERLAGLLEKMGVVVGETHVGDAVEPEPTCKPCGLRVKIIKSSKDTYWYADRIGQVFDVIRGTNIRGTVEYQCELPEGVIGSIGYIEAEDCVEMAQ